MTTAGLRTTSLQSTSVADEVLVNRQGSTFAMQVGQLSAQLQVFQGPDYENASTLLGSQLGRRHHRKGLGRYQRKPEGRVAKVWLCGVRQLDEDRPPAGNLATWERSLIKSTRRQTPP